MPYHHLAIELNERQAQNAMKGKGVRITTSQVGKGRLILHPVNKKKVEKAIAKGKALTLELSPAELAETALYHMQHEMHGSGFWSKIWEGLKKGWKFLKDSGLATAGLDAGMQALIKSVPESAPVATIARAGIKKIAGVGVRMNKRDRYKLLKGKGLYLS